MQPIFLAAGIVAGLAWQGAAADMAVITDSGSTNMAGFRIEVEPSGDGVYTAKPRRAGQVPEAQTKPRSKRIPPDAVKRFYAALDAAKPFSGLPHGGCMKSASFGTTMVVEYQGDETPDLRCGDYGDAKMKALIQATDDVIKAFDGE